MAVAFLPACPDSAPQPCSLLGTNPCSLPHSQLQGFPAELTLPCPPPTLAHSMSLSLQIPQKSSLCPLGKEGWGVELSFQRNARALLAPLSIKELSGSQVNHTKRFNVPLGEGAANPDPCAISRAVWCPLCPANPVWGHAPAKIPCCWVPMGLAHISLTQGSFLSVPGSPALQMLCYHGPSWGLSMQDLYRRKQSQQEGKLALQPSPPSATAREIRSPRASALAAPAQVAGCVL